MARIEAKRLFSLFFLFFKQVNHVFFLIDISLNARRVDSSIVSVHASDKFRLFSSAFGNHYVNKSKCLPMSKMSNSHNYEQTRKRALEHTCDYSHLFQDFHRTSKCNQTINEIITKSTTFSQCVAILLYLFSLSNKSEFNCYSFTFYCGAEKAVKLKNTAPEYLYT